MANLQYIGARYVPKFYENSLDPSSMEWESGKVYEPLTVVSYYSVSYTSKIPVPATVGNPAANPIYWAKTTDLPAAIASLQNQVDANTNNIKSLENYKDNGLSINVFDVLTIPSYIDTLAGASGYSLQGGTYNPIANEIFLLVKDSLDNPIAVRVNGSDMKTVIARESYATEALGHANDACYNPTTQKYYVVCAYNNGIDYNNKVAVINSGTLAIEEYISLSPVVADGSTASWLIAYDANNDCYYTRSDVKIQKYDNAFNLISESDISSHNIFIGGIFNGDNKLGVGELYHGRYYMMGYAFDLEHKRHAFNLMAFNPDSGELVQTNDVFASFVNEEAEFMFVKDDILYCAFGQSMFAIKQLITQDIASVENTRTLFATHRTLPDNYDLNDLFEIGVYRIGGNYASILNSYLPAKRSVIIVVPTANDSIMQYQLAMDTGEPVFAVRAYNVQSAAWSSWTDFGNRYEPNGNAINMTISNLIAPATLGSDAKTIAIPIQLPRKLVDLNNANFSFTGSLSSVRLGNGRYIESGTINLTDTAYSISCNHSQFTLNLRISKADGTAFNDNNNTPLAGNEVAIAVGTVGIQYTP